MTKKITRENIRKLLMKLLSFLASIIDDILLIIGIALLARGVFMISIPAGYIVLGLCFIAFAYLLAKRR